MDCCSHRSNCFLFSVNLSTRDYSAKCNSDYSEFSISYYSNIYSCADREYSKSGRSIVDDISDTLLSYLVVEHFIRNTIAQKN